MVLTRTVKEGVWDVKESTALSSLTIAEGASLAAPEGKSLTMTVDGVGTEIKSGTYSGDIFISVTDSYFVQPGGLMRRGNPQEFRTAILIEDGKLVPEKSVQAIVQGGEVNDKETNGVIITGCEESFNGIVVDGDSEYTINNATIDFEGNGANDFIGLGAGIACFGNAKVTINDSDIKLKGVTRCTFHAGGNSVTTLNNCRLTNESPPMEGFLPMWALGLNGTNRATQLCDSATVYYNNCIVSSNGWGTLSIDGGIRVSMYLKDSTIELKGPRARGYGAFSIGNALVSYDNCTVNVQGYPILIGGGASFNEGSNAEITNGSVINSNLFGVMIFRDGGGELKINNAATLNSDSSTFVVKGSNHHLTIDNAVLNPKNGVILQLMDNDDPGMGPPRFIPPVGADSPMPGRDLTVADPEEDVFMNISNMEATGDFYNSTTNLKANCREKPGAPPMTMPDMGEEGPPGGMMDTEIKQGVKNLDINFINARIIGVISAATATYREGVVIIGPDNRNELTAVIQTANAPVNNGVIAAFDKNSVWTIAGTSYLTSLTIDEGAVIKAPEGKTLTMTVDGVEKEIAPGSYKGLIVMNIA